MTTYIFNKVLKEEKVPSAWKKGVVTALYKGGRKQELGNYRGITVNSSMYKLFTRILRRRLEEEVEERGILGEIQFGFRKDVRCHRCYLRYIWQSWEIG